MKLAIIYSYILSLTVLSRAQSKTLRNSSKQQSSRQLDGEVNIECIVSEIDGLFPPEEGDREESIYGCASNEDDSMYFFNGDPTTLLGENVVNGETLLSVSLDAFTSEGLIDVEKASIPGASTVTLLDDNSTRRRRRLTSTGIKKVLVIRVESSDGSIAPSQSEAQMANDVFEDENNLAKRYDECSNGKLQFQPATGNGVITVKTSKSLNGMKWQDCGDIALLGAQGITRDHTMIVCPAATDFGGAAAWGTMPGNISWYTSKYASAPIAQMHEVGHNLGHAHSGKGGVTYADPTCNMGNTGSWSDKGSRYCFNAAKTFVNGWYSEYDHTMDPSTQEFDGKMYGINAVRDGTIPSNGKVVMKLQGQGEKALYLMFQRKAGANSEIPQDGDKVVITEQQFSLKVSSSWQAALGEGESFSFGWGSGSSEIKVCDINLTESSAKIVVGKSGQVSCGTVTSSPSSSPTRNILEDELEKCQDVHYKFQWSATKMKTCKFVSNKLNRCDRDGIAALCPVTCAEHVGKPCEAFDRTKSFNVQKIKRSCEEAAQAGLCGKNKVRSFCPISCGVV